jgi:hypothetical protein
MNILLYLLQVTACTAVFYLFYFLLLSRLTFFTTNRWYLLVSLILSFTIPVLRITLSEQHPYVAAVQQVIYHEQHIQPEAVTPIIVQEPIGRTLEWDSILRWCYYAVAIALTIHLLATLLVFFKRIKGKRIISIGKVRVLSGQQKVVNGSFLNYIFLNDDELSPEEMQQIIAHELLHVKLYHSADRILMKIAQIILWFNPFIYLYARSVEENHEFEVDREIARSTDKHDYANLLLHLSVARQGMLYHSFSKVPLKKRISMLFTKPSNKMKRMIYVLIVPVVLISCLAFARLKKADEQKPLVKKLPTFTEWRNEKQQELAAWQKTDDYKQKRKLMMDISGKIVTVKVKSVINNEGILISYHHHDYILDTRFGQDKQLRALLKAGEDVEMKTFGGSYDMTNNKLRVGAGSIYKNGKLIFQLAESAPISKQPFLSEINHVHYADGQITHIEKYANGKWKSAVLEVVNGYKFKLNFKSDVPDFKNIEDADHVRLRFVNEVAKSSKEYVVNDWLSITTNIKDYGIKNPELFSRFYTKIKKPAVTTGSNIQGVAKLDIAINAGKSTSLQYYKRRHFKNDDGTSYDQIVISIPPSGEVMQTLSPNEKPGFIIDKKIYNEEEFKKILPSVVKSFTGHYGTGPANNSSLNHGLNASGYDVIFSFNTEKRGDSSKVSKTALPENTKSILEKMRAFEKGKGKELTSGTKTGSNIHGSTKSDIIASDEDSTVDDIAHHLHYLYGNAHVTYGDFELNADLIRVDEKNHLIFASGRIDAATKRYIGKPVVKMGKEDQLATSDSLLFYIETKKLHFWNGSTKWDLTIGANKKTDTYNSKNNMPEFAYQNILLSSHNPPFPDTHFGIVVTKGISDKN